MTREMPKRSSDITKRDLLWVVPTVALTLLFCMFPEYRNFVICSYAIGLCIFGGWGALKHRTFKNLRPTFSGLYYAGLQSRRIIAFSQLESVELRKAMSPFPDLIFGYLPEIEWRFNLKDQESVFITYELTSGVWVALYLAVRLRGFSLKAWRKVASTKITGDQFVNAIAWQRIEH